VNGALSVAVSGNALTRPIVDGRAHRDQQPWDVQAVHPSELFWRQLATDEFDVFEMSLSTCFRLDSLGDRRWVVLPIFTTRTLCHLSILVRDGAGIDGPAALAGRRIGVPEYQQTSAVWSRGVLWHDFGVDPRRVQWHMERGEDRSHGTKTAFAPPAGVTVTPIDPDESIGSLLRAGRLDGTLLYLGERNLVDRSPSLSPQQLGLRPLFEPGRERERLGSGPLHATHAVAVRREAAEARPGLLAAVHETFEVAKALALDGAEDTAPYGFEANARMLSELAGHLYEQGITPRRVDPAILFAEAAALGATREDA
jgi:4,5-dihydroxyphthalate decarboxylase